MSRPRHYCLFDTAIGPCGVAWSADGLTHLQLPESDRAATERRLARSAGSNAPDDPPEPVAQAIKLLQDYFAGKPVDFSLIALDLAGMSSFHRQVYEAARRIGFGRTTSYGELARQLDPPGVARAVGQAMGHNPLPVIIPCHRVLASGKEIGGFSAFGGRALKQRLLALEGVDVGEAPRLPGL